MLSQLTRDLQRAPFVFSWNRVARWIGPQATLSPGKRVADSSFIKRVSVISRHVCNHHVSVQQLLVHRHVDIARVLNLVGPDALVACRLRCRLDVPMTLGEQARPKHLGLLCNL